MILIIAVGQAGIQASRNITNQVKLLIDTEPKTFYNQTDTTSILVSSDGRGNNWAAGYTESTISKIQLSISKIIEKHSITSISILNSIAGGTGSGLGSRILETIKQAHPKLCTLTYLITPFQSGDTALQNYNSILSLAWNIEFSDMTTLFNNTQILSQFKQKNVSLSLINDKISFDINSIISPINKSRFDCWDHVYSLIPFKYQPFVSINSISRSKSQSWNDCDFDRFVGDVYKSRMIVRGDSRSLYEWETSIIFKKLTKRVGIMDVVYSMQSDSSSSSSSAVFCKNSNDVVKYLEYVVDKGEMLLESGAYLHWMRKYDTEIDQVLRECFERVKCIINSY